MEPAFQKIVDEYNQLTAEMSSGRADLDLAKLGKRQASLQPLVEKINRLDKTEKDLKSAEELLTSADKDMAQMASEEIAPLKQEILNLQSAIEEALLPKDPNDEKDCLVEIRAGAGGDEATLFAAEYFRALGKFAEENSFKLHIVSTSKSEAGGFKEVIFEISGTSTSSVSNGGAFGIFKFESGVHRVQRVPDTEKSGRVHTSTITVAVLPELEENDYKIDPKDLKIEATTSSGHGGQSVNTTYSAIRIVHIPTGITAQCQDERSQAQNREKALAVIRSRVAAHFAEIENAKIRSLTKSQIGTGDRSEKIRTYNFPQDRVTDHRINQNFNQINLIMEGKFSPIIAALQKADLELKKEALKNEP
jgi:peptide chain release factor 1